MKLSRFDMVKHLKKLFMETELYEALMNPSQILLKAILGHTVENQQKFVNRMSTKLALELTTVKFVSRNQIARQPWATMWAKILGIEPIDMFRCIEQGLGYSYFKDLSPLGSFSKQDYLIYPEEDTEDYRVGNTQMFSVFNYGFNSIEWTMADLNTKDDNNNYHPINAKTADIKEYKLDFDITPKRFEEITGKNYTAEVKRIRSLSYDDLMEQIIKKPTEIGVLMVAQPINMIRKFVGQTDYALLEKGIKGSKNLLVNTENFDKLEDSTVRYEARKSKFHAIKDMAEIIRKAKI
jgi:hypothetical protein